MTELKRLTAEEDKQQEDHNQHEPPKRKPRMDQASSSLDTIFDEIANEQASAALTPSAHNSAAYPANMSIWAPHGIYLGYVGVNWAWAQSGHFVGLNMGPS
ncbi:hypothetical protein Q8A67_012452 [Cirrhinus molitorella]|uniref:Uncharacterized protein n=1 Tax=Cirrhinus molitorella TaxID=172907 RepID=A0AA88PMC8_9TELE|nr:hypothetical protein Q8A67_012452 [Cirrhinus molitorella]